MRTRRTSWSAAAPGVAAIRRQAPASAGIAATPRNGAGSMYRSPCAKAEVEPIGRRADRIAGIAPRRRRPTAHDARRPYVAVRPSDCADDHVAHAGDDAAERHDSGSGGDAPATRRRLVLQAHDCPGRTRTPAHGTDRRSALRPAAGSSVGASSDQRRRPTPIMTLRDSPSARRASGDARRPTAWRAGAARPWCGSATPGSR